jgi:hypothetical protein
MLWHMSAVHCKLDLYIYTYMHTHNLAWLGAHLCDGTKCTGRCCALRCSLGIGCLTCEIRTCVYVYICMYVCLYTWMFVENRFLCLWHSHVCVYACMYVYLCLYACVCVCMCMCVLGLSKSHVCACTFLRIIICTYLYLYVCMYACIHIYTWVAQLAHKQTNVLQCAWYGCSQSVIIIFYYTSKPECAKLWMHKEKLILLVQTEHTKRMHRLSTRSACIHIRKDTHRHWIYTYRQLYV